MNILILAVAIYTNCLQCVNGYIDVPCDRCNGRGYTFIKLKKIPCRYCPDGLYDQRKISTGRKKIKCLSCNGKRKLKASAPQERNSRAGYDTTKAGISNPLASQQKKW